MESYFAMTQKTAEKLATTKELTGNDLKILLHLLSRMDKLTLSQTCIATHLNMQQSQVSASIKRLADFGVIRKIDGNNGYAVSESLVSRGTASS